MIPLIMFILGVIVGSIGMYIGLWIAEDLSN